MKKIDSIDIQNDALDLQKWYLLHRRKLPWRSGTSKKTDPYPVWISEIMLQQTTVAVVIPYFEKFMIRFPTVHELAKASIEDVYALWAGLGYYSRARNLHKSAQIIAELGFPQTAEELLKLPGFGPYTSRAVASLAFHEPVGVLDGNVIRVLSRRFAFQKPWWTTEGRTILQSWSDQLTQTINSSDINQGLMELGATLCSPEKPLCWNCPWNQRCLAHQKQIAVELPLKKPRKNKILWQLTPEIQKHQKNILLVKNETAPFLKNTWTLPGEMKKLTQKPKNYLFSHSITHHMIYVLDIVVKQKKVKPKASSQTQLWSPLSDVSQHSPTSLTQKILTKASIKK